jgi:hypothetical protein
MFMSALEKKRKKALIYCGLNPPPAEQPMGGRKEPERLARKIKTFPDGTGHWSIMIRIRCAKIILSLCAHDMANEVNILIVALGNTVSDSLGEERRENALGTY